jgi:membrane-bound metal-dependent hydrolase YbcI (DUF457 family)
MRTYTHVLLTLAVARRFGTRSSAWAAAGAILPDLPIGAGAIWLLVRQGFFTREQFFRQACAKETFRVPDTALHSAPPVAAALALYGITGANRHLRSRSLTALLLGWAGHLASDLVTHGGDTRPLFWPFSGKRFASPVSYWEVERYGRLFALAEHAAAVAAGFYLLTGRSAREDGRSSRTGSGRGCR